MGFNTKAVSIAAVVLIVIVAVAGVAYWKMNDDGGAVKEDLFVPYEMKYEGEYGFNALSVVNEDLTEMYWGSITITVTADSITFSDVSKIVRTSEDTYGPTWQMYVEEAKAQVFDRFEWLMPGIGIEEIQEKMLKSFGFLDGWTAVPTSVDYESMVHEDIKNHNTEFTAYKFIKGSDVMYVTTEGRIVEYYMYDPTVPGQHLDFYLAGCERLSEYGPSNHS